MNKNRKSSLLLFLLMILFCCLLFFSKDTVFYAKSGLNAWFQNMIPTLFPFMVLTGIMLRTGLSTKLANLFAPVLGRIYHISNDSIYIVIMGFLCGFPMGAALIGDSLRLSKISHREAGFLLSFCNNIGPVYFISFVLPSCPIGHNLGCLFIMYLVPLIYGLIIRYTYYAKLPQTVDVSASASFSSLSLLDAFQESLEKAIENITLLGGYMIVFNVLNVFIKHFLQHTNTFVQELGFCFMEISGGISNITNTSLYPFVYILLPFGGICCIAQTICMLRDSNLSIKQYLFHKCMQVGLTLICYLFLL